MHSLNLFFKYLTHSFARFLFLLQAFFAPPKKKKKSGCYGHITFFPKNSLKRCSQTYSKVFSAALLSYPLLVYCKLFRKDSTSSPPLHMAPIFFFFTSKHTQTPFLFFPILVRKMIVLEGFLNNLSDRLNVGNI